MFHASCWVGVFLLFSFCSYAARISCVRPSAISKRTKSKEHKSDKLGGKSLIPTKLDGALKRSIVSSLQYIRRIGFAFRKPSHHSLTLISDSYTTILLTVPYHFWVVPAFKLCVSKLHDISTISLQVTVVSATLLIWALWTADCTFGSVSLMMNPFFIFLFCQTAL